MRNLRLVGLSNDRASVIFVDDAGSEFAAPVDARLRAAVRGDRARIGQLEIDMDSALRPRDIQARIRSGHTPEEVAAAAQVPVDKIMGYAVPVLAERQHVAEVAQRSPVRRRGSEGTVRRLDDMVRERLGTRNVPTDSVDWDSWRRDDGRWSLQLTYRSGERTRTAMFVYDATGRYSVADDDEARWLTGEKQLTRKGPQPRAAGSGERRSHDDDGDDLLSLAEGPDYEFSDDLTAVVRAVSDDDSDDDVPAAVPFKPVHLAASRLSDPASGDADQAEAVDEPRPDQARLDRPGSDDPAVIDPAMMDSVPVDAAAPDHGPDETVGAVAGGDAGADAESRRSRRRRPSIPSWDEIMFGKGEESK
jgi:Protein of unknown function (DUF3071)